MKSYPLKSFACYLVLIALIVGGGVGLHSFLSRKQTFIDRWQVLFSEYYRTDGRASWRVGDRPDLIYRRNFTDGSWIAARSSSQAGGDSFDVTVILDSKGRITCTDYPFSGYEGLAEELARVPAESLESFYYSAKIFHFKNLAR